MVCLFETGCFKKDVLDRRSCKENTLSVNPLRAAQHHGQHPAHDFSRVGFSLSLSLSLFAKKSKHRSDIFILSDTKLKISLLNKQRCLFIRRVFFVLSFIHYFPFLRAY